MKVQKRLVKLLAAFALICGLSISAHAQLGSGWTPDNETYIAQTSSGCTITAISGGFEFSVPSGLGRAEQRGNNLPTTTTNQWQGFATLKSFPSGSDKICVHQVFGPAPSTPDLILDEATYSGGIEIMSLEQSDAFEAQIQVGVQFQLNTIYDPVGNLITIYVNGSQTGTKVPNSGVHYNKFGQYVSSSGTGPATMDWVNIQSWAGGTASGGGGTTVATPSFSPGGGTFTSAQSVSISDSTSGATIHYTTDGSTPTTSSTTYSGSISVSSGTVTIKAIGAKSGDTTSSVASATYTISSGGTTVATPTFSPGGGTFTSAQSVSISDSTSGATIHYTTDGSTPTASSTTYSGSISVSSGTVTIKAIGVKSGDTNSSVASATYTIGTVVTTVATPTFSPAGGTYTAAQTVTISDSTSGASIRYTTDGSTPSATAGTLYSGPVSISATTTLKAIGFESGDTNSAVASATYTISTGGGGGCQTATGSWTGSAATSVSGTFTATFDATPHASGITAFIGMTSGAQTSKSTAPWLVKFHSTGDLQAINGSSYTATNTINWVSGDTYHFRVVVNLTASTYSVFVTPPGGAEQTLATNFAFQASATSLDHWGFQDTASSLVLCNFAD